MNFKNADFVPFIHDSTVVVEVIGRYSMDNREEGRVFRDRKDPFEVYLSERAFMQRYRLTRDQVGQLALEYSRSEWANKGTKQAKALSHRERVCI